jgi:hypothetical protein
MPMEDDDLLDMASAQKRTRTLQKVGIKKKTDFIPYLIIIGFVSEIRFFCEFERECQAPDCYVPQSS